MTIPRSPQVMTCGHAGTSKWHRKYNPVDEAARKHGPRWERDIPGPEHGSLRRGRRCRRAVLVPLGGLRHRAKHAGRRGLPLCRRRVGLVLAAQLPSARAVPHRHRRVHRVHRLVRALGALVLRPGPDLGGVQPHRVLPGGGRRTGPHFRARAAAAHGGVRLPGRRGRGRRLRVPRQGTAGRGHARSRLRPARQPGRLLERAGAHDGHGPVRGARGGRRPRHAGLAADAGRRRRGPHVPRLLLHLLAGRLADPGARRRPLLRLHHHEAGERRFPRGDRDAGGARAVAASRTGDVVRRDDGRCSADAPGAHDCCAGPGPPCWSPRACSLRRPWCRVRCAGRAGPGSSPAWRCLPWSPWS